MADPGAQMAALFRAGGAYGVGGDHAGGAGGHPKGDGAANEFAAVDLARHVADFVEV